MKKSCFPKECTCCRKKEDHDIDPVGRFAEDAVIGIKKHGNEQEPQKDTSQFYAPKPLDILKKETLDQCEEKHRKK